MANQGHTLTQEDRKKGGENSHTKASKSNSNSSERGGSGNFAQDRQKASEAGRKGGKN